MPSAVAGSTMALIGLYARPILWLNYLLVCHRSGDSVIGHYFDYENLYENYRYRMDHSLISWGLTLRYEGQAQCCWEEATDGHSNTCCYSCLFTVSIVCLWRTLIEGVNYSICLPTAIVAWKLKVLLAEKNWDIDWSYSNNWISKLSLITFSLFFSFMVIFQTGVSLQGRYCLRWGSTYWNGLSCFL